MKPFSTVESAIAWAEPQDWCQQMADCIQDKGYHAEGNVWPHTQMVLRQLEKHSRWAGLPQADKETLIAAALLHDSGKPATTVEEDGKISRWIRLARDYHYRIRIVYIEPDLATIIEQNSQRPDPVPESVVLKLLEKLDTPCTSEAHDLQLLPL
jgi:putative nucleotidyltransferase with HDIG domain